MVAPSACWQVPIVVRAREAHNVQYGAYLGSINVCFLERILQWLRNGKGQGIRQGWAVTPKSFLAVFFHWSFISNFARLNGNRMLRQ